jgi:hypothetical protein
MALPFGLATAKENAILEPPFVYQLLPYCGLAFFVIAFAFAHRRRPATDRRRLAVRAAFLVWMIAAVPIWVTGERNEALKFVGSLSLVLLLATPWWFAVLSGPARFAARRLLFGALYWGGFVSVWRLFPTFNETSKTDVEYTSLDQTRAALKLYGVLLIFWLLQIGAVLLARRIAEIRRRSAH